MKGRAQGSYLDEVAKVIIFQMVLAEKWDLEVVFCFCKNSPVLAEQYFCFDLNSFRTSDDF